MGFREMWREWSAERSPWARARKRDERLAKAIEALPLATAEKIVASWVGQPPIETSDPEAYTDAFVSLRAGFAFGRHTIGSRSSVPPQPHELGSVVVWRQDEAPLYVRPGELVVRRAGEVRPVHASIAHAAIAVCALRDDVEVIEALVRRADAPMPRCGEIWRAALIPSPRASPELTGGRRSLALVGITVSLLGACCVMIGFLSLRHGVGCPLFFLCIGAALIGSQIPRQLELAWWEPPARRLAISERGFIHPRTGAAVCWSDVVRKESRWRRAVLVLSDGEHIVVPWSVFADPEHAAAWLAQHVGREHAPYRGR